MNLRGDDYRRGALERLSDSFVLMRAEHFAGAASDAGRAVESMLRAVIWLRDAEVRTGRKSLETGHDLRELLTRVRSLGLIRASNRGNERLEEQIQHVARLWFNNMRFASSKFVETRWYNLGEVRRGRSLKQATEQFYLDCHAIVKRCEILCQR